MERSQRNKFSAAEMHTGAITGDTISVNRLMAIIIAFASVLDTWYEHILWREVYATGFVT